MRKSGISLIHLANIQLGTYTKIQHGHKKQERLIMEKHLYKPFKSKDNDGNDWQLAIIQQESYPNRFDLKFSFCGKSYQIHHFRTERDATNVWELLEGISKRKKEDGSKRLISNIIKRARKNKPKTTEE